MLRKCVVVCKYVGGRGDGGDFDVVLVVCSVVLSVVIVGTCGCYVHMVSGDRLMHSKCMVGWYRLGRA